MVLPRFPASPLLACLVACQPATMRPAFGPLPAATEAVVDLTVAKATSMLAEALRADSIPVSRIEPRDGYFETGWFVAVTGAPSAERTLGDSLVRVRGWVNAYGRERGSIRVETALRPLANPALPPRELDQQAPADNPAAMRVARTVADMARRYPVPGAEPAVVAPAAPADSAKAPRDSAAAPTGGKTIKPYRPPPPTPNP
jgi:hypothetical protein